VEKADRKANPNPGGVRSQLAKGAVVGTTLGAVFGVTIGDLSAGVLLGGMIGLGSVLLWNAVEDD